MTEAQYERQCQERDYELERAVEIALLMDRLETAESHILHHEKKARDYRHEFTAITNRIISLGGKPNQYTGDEKDIF